MNALPGVVSSTNPPPIDVVYVFKPAGSGDLELFYSLRSVAKHLKGYRKIWVWGDTPCFKEELGVDNVLCKVSQDPFAFKQHNVRKKLLEIVHTPAIADTFILMNDDFFLLKDLDVRTMPYYRQGTLKMHWEWRKDNEPASPYTHAIKNTWMDLERLKLPILDYELHIPMRLNKVPLFKILDDAVFDWMSESGLLPRSLYGNLGRLPCTTLPGLDVKVNSPVSPDEIRQRFLTSQFLSTGPGALNEFMFEALKDHFPNPKHEID